MDLNERHCQGQPALPEKQLVAGLLTDGNGEPLSIQLYRGNTGDPPTFLDAVEKLKVFIFTVVPLAVSFRSTRRPDCVGEIRRGRRRRGWR
jgi:hypothetical protein